MSKLNELELKNKKVILRVDFDVPMQNGQITDDYRIIAAIPTIKYLLDQGAAIIGVSHLGRPDGHFFAEFSLKPTIERLAKFIPQYPISYSDEIISFNVRKEISHLKPRQIFFLGNIRFSPEEESNNQYFANEIAKYGDIFVNDAFAVCHRNHASVIGISKFLPSYPGFEIEAEIIHLKRLLNENLERPFVVVIGGKKAETKIPTLKNLLPKVDRIFVGGALGNTFLKAAGHRVGESLIDKGQIYLAELLLDEFKEKIVLPEDWLTNNDDPDNFSIMDIGQKTIENFNKIIAGAKTIFWNGTMGMAEIQNYSRGTKEVGQAIADATGYKVAAGGDTIAAIRQLRIDHGFDFISTGGGATLSYLAGETLSGLVALGLQ